MFDDWARSERNPDGTVGKVYTADQVAEYFDGLAKKMYDGREARRKSLFGDAAPGTADRELQPPGRDPRGNGSEPRTKVKAPARKLSKDEQEQEDLAALRRGIEADRAAALKASK